jgi:hypothetical protein
VSGPDLGTQARGFAEVLQSLLNRTVCDNARVSAVVNKRVSGNAHIGTRLSRDDFSTGKVQMRSRARTKIWLDVSSVWFQNDEGYLTAKSTYCGIWLGGDSEALLLHYDYEREKDLYTEAHVQVGGRHPELEAMLAELGRAGDQLKDLHLPVGGRRLRPCLEDVLESLIAENLVDGKTGYKEILDSSRRDYRKIQIAAIVRSNQETSAAALRAAGWEVSRQQDGGIFSSLRRRK